MPSPTQKVLKSLRDAGYRAAIVERWNTFAKIRSDLFGCIDILAVLGPQTIGLQVTTMSHMDARFEKIRRLPDAKLWLAGGTRRLLIIGTAKRGPRGKRKVWTERMWECYLDQGKLKYRVGGRRRFPRL